MAWYLSPYGYQRFVACMVITGEERSSLDIWPETPNQDTGTEDIILTT